MIAGEDLGEFIQKWVAFVIEYNLPGQRAFRSKGIRRAKFEQLEDRSLLSISSMTASLNSLSPEMSDADYWTRVASGQSQSPTNVMGATTTFAPLSTFGIDTVRYVDPVTGSSVTRYSSADNVLFFHDDSGQTTSYSPSGQWLGLYLANSEQWLLIDRTTGLGRVSHNKAVGANGIAAGNSVLQWTANNTLLVLAGAQVSEVDPVDGMILRQLTLTTPNASGADYSLWRSGESTGQQYLHVAFEKFVNGQLSQTISVIDTLTWTVAYQYPFDQNVHQGDSLQDRWRHLYLVGDRFYTQLEFPTVPNTPHEFFHLDGTGWEQLDNRDANFPLVRQQDLTHPAYSTNRMIAGDTMSSAIYVTDTTQFNAVQAIDLQAVTGTTTQFYRHATVGPNNQMVFSVFDTIDDSDESIYLLDPQTGIITLKASVDHLVTPGPFSFQSGARPQLTSDQIAWHSNAVNRTSVEVYTLDLVQDLAFPDFGDAPAPYPTIFDDDGARHELFGLTLGTARDGEFDATPSVGALGDDSTSTDDEDGVTFGQLIQGQSNVPVTVNVQGSNGKLDAWIDFNGDGDWNDVGEQIFNDVGVSIGDNALTFPVPATAVPGATYARFRLSTIGGLSVTGRAADGEVEDHQVTITTLDDGLVTYWDFEGNTLDHGTDGLQADTGAIAGSATIAAGGLGTSALDVLGTGAVMTAPTSVDINSPFTQKSIALWFYPQDRYAAGRQVIYQQGGTSRGMNIYLEGANLYAGAWNAPNGWSGTWLSDSGVLDKQWNHVILQFDSVAGEVKLDLNGGVTSSGAAFAIVGHNPATLGSVQQGTRFSHGAGSVASSSPSSFAGYVDDVRIYNRPLTDAEVSYLASATPTPFIDLDEGLVTYWDFEGDANDSAIVGLQSDDGTLLGGAQFVDGGLGTSALGLYGNGDVMTVATSSDINATFARKSIALWFYPHEASATGRQVLYQQGGTSRGMNIFLEGGSLFAGAWNEPNGWSGTWLSAASVADSQWNHVTLQFDSVSGDLQLNLNGGASLNGPAFAIVGHNPATLGSVQQGTRFPNGPGSVESSALSSFRGYVDDVRIYNRTLAPAEVTALAADTPSDPIELDRGLVTYWDFEGNALDTAGDGAQADHGTLVGTAAIVSGGLQTSALELLGGGDLMSVPSSTDINANFTKKSIAMWFYPQNANAPGRQVIYQQGGTSRGMNIYLEGGSLYAGAWNEPNGWSGTWIESANVLDAQWNHVTLQFDSVAGELRVDLNGGLSQTGPAFALAGHNPATIGAVQLGTRYANGTGSIASGALDSFVGYVDDVRIYDRTLSSAEVLMLGSETSVNSSISLNLDTMHPRVNSEDDNRGCPT